MVDFRSIPKIELHLHLDCSLSYSVASTLNPSLSLSDFERQFIAPPKCHDLADYLTRARAGVALMQTEEALRLVVADLFDQLLDDHVLYAEIRFAPHLHTEKGLNGEQVVEIVDDAVNQNSERTGIEARLILCTLRHFPAERSLQTVQLVERFLGRHVVALDIAGDEAGFPIEQHIPAFSHAINNNIPRTAHAGEARGAGSVWETLHHFKTSRIGHGVRSLEDATLIDHLRAGRIHLEVCPTSNVQTNIVAAHRDHPVATLYDSGVPVSINTDARTISNVTLMSEYEVLHREFGWDIGHFRQCNLYALEAAFIAESVKREIKGRLLDEYASFV